MRPELNALALATLRRMPFSSELFGPLRGRWSETSAWCKATRGDDRSEPRIIVPSASVRRCPPVTLDGSVPWQFGGLFGGSETTDPPGWVIEIPQGRVVGEGAVVAPDDRLLVDVSREILSDQSKHSASRRWSLPPAQRMSGRVAVLSVAGPNYWHWTFDLLPRLLLLQQHVGSLDTIDAFITNPLTERYQHDTLARLGVPRERILEGDTKCHLKADCLIVPSLFQYAPSGWACERLRERLSTGQAAGTRRLYLSRSDANRRRVVNERELFAALAPLGFEHQRLSGLSMREQSTLFASSEAVVGPHGAGLTNLLFCHPDATIVELFAPSYINTVYWIVSNHLGLHYCCAIGSGEATPRPPVGVSAEAWFWARSGDANAHGADITVDVGEVVALIKRELDLRSRPQTGYR